MKIPENFDRWMFDYKEGNLSASEQEAFENFLIQHPEFEVDADAWDQAFIRNEEVAYPNAHTLEKKRKVAAGWYAWSAAAVLFLLLGTTAIYLYNDDTTLAEANFSSESVNNNNYSSDDSNNNLYTADFTTSQSFQRLADLAFEELTGGFDAAASHSAFAGNNQASVYPVGGQVVQGSSEPFFDPNTALVTDLTNYQQSVGGGNNADLVEGEANKLNGNDNSAKYLGNPESKNLGFDVSKKKVIKYNSFVRKVKKLYHNIEKTLTDPIALTNLRDPELLLPQSTLLSFNPSFAGGMMKSRFDMNYRNQWLGTSMMSQEMNISFDSYLSPMRGGIGVLVNAQDFGMGQFGDYNISLIYSPKMVVNKYLVLEPSVKLTMGTLMGNGDKLAANSTFEMDRGRVISTIDDAGMNGITRQWYKDYGLGLMVNTDWFYAGFSADNLSQHYENVYGNDLSSPTKSPVRMTAIIGADTKDNGKGMVLSPFAAYQQYGDVAEFWGGANWKVNNFTIGASANTNKEFTASVGIKLDRFKLVYHYDHTESVVMNDYYGSHNIGIRFNAKRKNQR